MPRVRPSGTESQIIISDDVCGPSLAGGVPLRALRAPSAGCHPVLPAWRESPRTLGTASRAFSGLRIRSRRPVWHGPLRQEARQASEERGQPRLPPLGGGVSPGWSSALPGAHGEPRPGQSHCRQKGPSPPRRLLHLRLPIQRCPRVSLSHPSFVLSGCLLSPTAPAHTDKSPDSSTSASRKEAQALRIAGRLPPGHCTPCGEEKEEHLLWAEGV